MRPKLNGSKEFGKMLWRIKKLIILTVLTISIFTPPNARSSDDYISFTVDEIDPTRRKAITSEALEAAMKLFPVRGYEGWILTGISSVKTTGSGGETHESETSLALKISPRVVLGLSVVVAEKGTMTANEYGTLSIQANIREYLCDGRFIQRENYLYGTKKMWRTPLGLTIRDVPKNSVFRIEERTVCAK